jgi:hypothetical protein
VTASRCDAFAEHVAPALVVKARKLAAVFRECSTGASMLRWGAVIERPFCVFAEVVEFPRRDAAQAAQGRSRRIRPGPAKKSFSMWSI